LLPFVVRIKWFYYLCDTYIITQCTEARRRYNPRPCASVHCRYWCRSLFTGRGFLYPYPWSYHLTQLYEV